MFGAGFKGSAGRKLLMDRSRVAMTRMAARRRLGAGAIEPSFAPLRVLCRDNPGLPPPRKNGEYAEGLNGGGLCVRRFSKPRT
jgi:hypothetical protein